MVVDGGGGEPVRADVAVDGRTISAVGEVAAAGREEIDAKGHLVTPGFVDLHTHLDAQIAWDPLLTPISWHGVTTALLGNCGISFAPCHGKDRELLAAMMETVEDIPRDAILNGLPWNWEGYGGYLDALEALRPAIHVAGLVGHCAVRCYVMGERAVDQPATDAERSAMAEVVGRSIAAGAVGFSTSRFPGHVLPDGRHVPGTHAEHAELLEIARAVAAHGGGLMQNVLNLGGDFAAEMDLVRKQAQTPGIRVLFSLAVGPADESGQRWTTRLAELRAQGLDVQAMCAPRSSGFVSGLANLLPWRTGAWNRLGQLDLGTRLAHIQNSAVCAELVAEARKTPSAIPATQIFPIGEAEPSYMADASGSLQALADAAGEHPASTFLRHSRESRGRALFTMRIFNRNLRALADLMQGENVLPGLGDAGAHVGQVMDAGWTSFVLSHWVRDAKLFSIGDAIRRMTSAPARVLGLSDRGRIQCGLRADLNVIDPERVREQPPAYVHDFPGGSGRFIARGVGYRATICNGQVILRDDEHTGARAGEVIRH
jgi:N-acyl-D-aspartate/D-glutamate deacylase